MQIYLSTRPFNTHPESKNSLQNNQHDFRVTHSVRLAESGTETRTETRTGTRTKTRTGTRTGTRTATRRFVPEKTHRMLRTIIIIIITIITTTTSSSGGSDDTGEGR
ncbi:uncharacterized [Tachysurus ichikawai]